MMSMHNGMETIKLIYVVLHCIFKYICSNQHNEMESVKLITTATSLPLYLHIQIAQLVQRLMYRLTDLQFHSQQGKTVHSAPNHPDQLLGPPRPYSMGTRGSFSRGKVAKA
jgi:hypothetical protein